MGREIQIIGGGLAGLTLGLLLRREGIPVEIRDAGSYPRHRVCGEFISGRGLQILHSLNLAGISIPNGAVARTVRFFNLHHSSVTLCLPEPALSIDRSQLDHLLAIEFRAAGGILHENRRWTAGFDRDGVVRATGRRLHKEKGSALIGLKIHASQVHLDADLELHFSDRGYVGISRLPNEQVNICGLFRNEVLAISRTYDGFLETFTRAMGTPLRHRLVPAAFDPATFSAVAGLSLSRERSASIAECRIGDAICMIPPLTGNGMSIALETASIAAPHLRDYSRGTLTWAEALSAISRSCDWLLKKRLFFAGFIQNLSARPAARHLMLSALNRIPASLRPFFALTR